MLSRLLLLSLLLRGMPLCCGQHTASVLGRSRRHILFECTNTASSTGCLALLQSYDTVSVWPGLAVSPTILSLLQLVGLDALSAWPVVHKP